jgi:hypothetical protein
MHASKRSFVRKFSGSYGLMVSVSLLAGATLAPAAEGLPGKKHSPAERMAPARLRAAHEDVLRIRAARQALPEVPGLRDYRAILHAHAEDSSHTGGTRPEMLAEARRAGVSAVLLTDHYRPPRDFIAESWRGLRDGVLFVPGSEARGFLLYPTRSIMGRMDEPTGAFIETVRADGGLIFLSHIEEQPDHPMEGLTGMEIYNRHFDAKNDAAGLLAIVLKLTSPASFKELDESLRLYPDELFATQVEYPAVYLAKWDRETRTRRLTGVAANDCHHNMVMIVKMIDAQTVRVGTIVDKDEGMRKVSAALRPGIRELTKGHKPGDVVARLDLDPYHRSFRNVSTHVLAPELTETAIRGALREGRAYVSHDWICDPTGFRFELVAGPSGSEEHVAMGAEVKFSAGHRLVARFPVSCHIRLLNNGDVIDERRGDRLEWAVREPGVFRVEGWLTLDGEERGWVYSNPIYIRR